jgi:hypothetical protein
MPIASFLSAGPRLGDLAASGGLLGSNRKGQARASGAQPPPVPVLQEVPGIALEGSLLFDEAPMPRSPTMADDGREDGEHAQPSYAQSSYDGGELYEEGLELNLADSRLDERGMARPSQLLAHARGGAGGASEAQATAEALQRLQLFPFRPPADLATLRDGGRLRETASLRPSDISYLADHADAVGL